MKQKLRKKFAVIVSLLLIITMVNVTVTVVKAETLKLYETEDLVYFAVSGWTSDRRCVDDGQPMGVENHTLYTTVGIHEARKDGDCNATYAVCRKKYDSYPSDHAGNQIEDSFCTYCGQYISPHTHDFEVAWSSDSTKHWHACTADGNTDDCLNEVGAAMGTHSGGTATCVDKAICEVCGVEYGTVDAANHTGDTVIKNAVEPTCSAKGYTGDIYCKDCDTKLETGTDIPMLGHKYGAWTAVDEKEHQRICENDSTHIEKADHTFENGNCTACGYAIEYKINAGENATWTLGSKTGLKVVSEADFSKFIGVNVDGKALDSANYTATSGSTEVTLKPEYLTTLSVGAHRIEILSKDGSAKTTFTIVSGNENGGSNADSSANNSSTTTTNNSSTTTSKKTGDKVPIAGLFVLMTLALAATAVMYRKKEDM